MMGWRSRITIIYLLYGMHNYKTILELLRKLEETKVLHGIGRVPQCSYPTLITMYLHQNNSDQVYGIEKNNVKNEVWCCYFNGGNL